MTEKYLITAATGQTGGAAVKELLASGKAVRALAHRADERSKDLQALGVEVVYGDLNDYGSVKNALDGIQRAYFCYPIADGQVQASAQFAQAAKNAGVKAIVNMSQAIAREDAKSPASFQHWLSEQVFDWSRVPTTHIRPTFFTDTWLAMQAPMIRQGKMMGPYVKGKTAFVSVADQGRVIARILENPGPHHGKVYPLFGPKEYTFATLAEAVGKTLGKTVTYEEIPLAAMLQGVLSGKPSAAGNNATNGYAESNNMEHFAHTHVYQHLDAAFHDFENGLFSGTNDVVEQITGRPPQAIEDFVTAHRSLFV